MGNYFTQQNKKLPNLEYSPAPTKSILNNESNKSELNQNEKNLVKLEYIIRLATGINLNNISKLSQDQKGLIKQRLINSPDKISILSGLNNLKFCPNWGTYISEIIEESILDLDKYAIAEDIYYKIQLKSGRDKKGRKLVNNANGLDKEKNEINKIKEILFNEENFKRKGKLCNLGILKGIVKIEKEYNILFSDKEKNIFFQDIVRNKSNVTVLKFSKYIKKRGLPNPPINEHKFYSPTNNINVNYLTYIIKDKSLVNTDFKKHANLYLTAIKRQDNASKIDSHNISLATKLSSNTNIHSEEIILELSKINTLKPGLDFLESGKINKNSTKINTRDAIEEILLNNNIDKTILFKSGKSVYFILSELEHKEREKLLNVLKKEGKTNRDYLKIYNIVLSLDILDKELDKRQVLARKGYSVENINKELEKERKTNSKNNTNAFIAIQPVVNQYRYIEELKADGFKSNEIHIIHLGDNLYKVNIAGANFGICDSSKKEVANVIDTANFLKELGVSFLFPYIDLILYELKVNASSNIGGLKLDIKNGLDIYEKAYLFRIISKLIFGDKNNKLSNILNENILDTKTMQRKLAQYAQENYNNINNKTPSYRFIAGEIENKRLSNESNQKNIWISKNGSTINIIALLKRVRELNAITK